MFIDRYLRLCAQEKEWAFIRWCFICLLSALIIFADLIRGFHLLSYTATFEHLFNGPFISLSWPNNEGKFFLVEMLK